MSRKQPSTVHARAIEVWMEYYRTKTGEKYSFTGGKDGAAMKQLLKKVTEKMKQRQIEQTDENILNSLSGFLQSVSDRWILDNLDLAVVNSKFNQIYVKAVKHNPFTRAERITEIVRDQFGADPERATG